MYFILFLPVNIGIENYLSYLPSNFYCIEQTEPIFTLVLFLQFQGRSHCKSYTYLGLVYPKLNLSRTRFT